MKIQFLMLLTLSFLVTGVLSAQTKPARETPVAVGTVAPDFTLKSETGKSVTLSKVGKPVVLVFFRGYWCPFCIRQLSELRGFTSKVVDFELFAISVDDPRISLELNGKIAADGKGKLGFAILSDANHQTIDRYGVFDPTYIGKKFEGIPHPTVVVIDERQIIRWIKIEPDYRKRPTNNEILEEIEKLAK